MHKSFIKILSILLIIGLNWAGLSAVGKTFAYFSDTEDSASNSFQTGILDMTVRSGQNNFTPNAENMVAGDQVNRDIYVGKTAGSSPLQYRVSYELIDGNEDLCNQLDLKIWYDHYQCEGSYEDCRDMRLTYNGKLSALDKYTNTDFIIPHPDDQFDTDPSDGTEQWFYYSIVVPNDIADSFQGEVCEFKFVFEGWQDNIDNYEDGGFTDVEEIENTIKIGYWNPPVVLNEFLPNAGNYPEFIELYSKTASSIDLNGFYIKANGDTIPINTTTTSTYSGGSTIIPANGWLVVTAGGDKIGDSSGTIALYNRNNVLVDSYTYGNPDHNVNNTPGSTNNMALYLPLDNDLLDQSGNGNNGINNGAVFAAGKINQGLSFDGVDDYAIITNSDDFDFGSGEFSVEFWTKTDSSSRQWVGTRYENYGPGWGLGTQNSHTLGYIRTSESGTNKTEAEGTVDVANDDWHHLIMVRIGGKIKIYTDGSFEKEGTLAGDVNNDEPIEIGRISWSGGSQYFKGLIDEVKIYNRALNATEISEHYSDVGSSGAVPSDKSYARIPDGADNWVDPIPTPGEPNILEAEIIKQEEVIEEEPIVEEPIAEELLVEETPVAEEEPVNKGEPVIEEEPAEEIPVIEEELVIEEESTEEEIIAEENQEQEGIIEEINEIIDEVIDEIVDEIMPDEEIGDGVVSEPEAPIIEDILIIEEASADEIPAVDEQLATVPDDSSSVQDGAVESGGDLSGDAGDNISE